MRKRFTLITAIISFSLNIIVTPIVAGNKTPVDCDALNKTNPRSEWLTLPYSRLVINPTLEDQRPLPREFMPSLPLRLGYYVGEKPVRLPIFWAWVPGGRGAMHPQVTYGPVADFPQQRANDWQAEGLKASFEGTGLRLKLTGTDPVYNWGALTRQVKVDLDKTPYVLVGTSSVDDKWFLQARPDSQAPCTYLIRETTQSGSAIADIKAATGWKGEKSFQLRLYDIGSAQANAVFNKLAFVGFGGSIPAFNPKSMDWYPHQIVAQASCSQLGIKVGTTTCLSDASTVAQALRVTEGSDKPLMLVGEFEAGSIKWDSARKSIVLTGDSFSSAIAFNKEAKWLGVYRSCLDWLENKPDPNASRGVWAVEFDNIKTGDEVVVASRFASNSELSLDVVDAANRAAQPSAFAEALQKQKTAWDVRLKRVPQPIDFDLHLSESYGVKPDDIRKMYYKAWAFLLSDIIPPMPENGYAYSQIGCGKPALWGEGHPKARASSQFESFAAMLLLAGVASDPAWNAYEGMMTLVGDDGVMEGEGLQPKHCQAAWALYSLTGDKTRLRSIYPAMKRLVLWKARDPRWVYGHNTGPERKMAMFVSMAMIDMTYAQRIAKVLNMPEEEWFWKDRINELSEEYIRWFWGEPGGPAYDNYYADTGKKESPGDYNHTYSLVLPSNVLPSEIRGRIVKAFLGYFKKDMPYLINCTAGYAGFTQTMRGLWQSGLTKEVAMMAEATMRNVTIADEFAESYAQHMPTFPTGVTPEVIGAGCLIEAVLWHNGVVLADGQPIIVHMADGCGVRNVSTANGPIDVEFPASTGKLRISGKGTAGLKLPSSYGPIKLSGKSSGWECDLPVGQQIDLGRTTPTDRH